MLVLGLIFILLFLQGLMTEVLKAKPIAYLSSLGLIGLFLYVTLGIYYTADYDMYYYFFKYEVETDFIFTKLTTIFKANGLDFHDLYVFHIISIVFLICLFIRQYSINIFFIFLFYITIEFVHFTNQIRYYLAFAFLLLSFHAMYKRRFIFMIVYGVLALLSHIAIAVLLTFIPIYYVIGKKTYFKQILIYSGICFLIVLGMFNTGWGRMIAHFGEYFEMTSSIVGGIYNAIPSILLVTYLYMESKKYMLENPNYVDDSKFMFLHKLSYYTIIFIPASSFMQIINHRYVIPFVVVYTIYFLYMIRDNSPNRKVIKLMGYCAVGFVACIFIYVLPTYILKENLFLHELDLMFKSVKYLNYREW